jgi:hypothetical protein
MSRRNAESDTPMIDEVDAQFARDLAENQSQIDDMYNSDNVPTHSGHRGRNSDNYDAFE